MRTGHGGAPARLVGVATAVLALALGATPAEAKPGDAKGIDRPARSERGNPPGQSGSDLNNPQPPSNADFSGHGANQHGPYDSTRDGSPSPNGNGDGKATGKPCAGCVGKADNKNPRGQLPGGSDPNSGYECDRNSGVGRGNPAHTACVEAAPAGVTPPGRPPAKRPPAAERPEQVPVAERVSPAGQAPEADQPAARNPAPQALATTGVDIAPPLTVGLALLGAGGVLLAAGRRGSFASRRRERYSHVDALYALTAPRERG